MDLPEEGIPEALLSKVEAIAVIPGFWKAAWVIGGRHGKGVILVRKGEGEWSYPDRQIHPLRFSLVALCLLILKANKVFKIISIYNLNLTSWVSFQEYLWDSILSCSPFELEGTQLTFGFL